MTRLQPRHRLIQVIQLTKLRLTCCDTQEEHHLYSPYISVIALDSSPPPSSSLSCSAPMLILMISFALCIHCHCQAESDASYTECGSYCSTNAHTAAPAGINVNLLLHCCACLPAKVRATLSGSLHHLVYLGIRKPLDISQALPAPWQLLGAELKRKQSAQQSKLCLKQLHLLGLHQESFTCVHTSFFGFLDVSCIHGRRVSAAIWSLNHGNT